MRGTLAQVVPTANTDTVIFTASANEYIENGAKVAALGVGHEIISRKISPGDRVIVNTNQSDTVFRVEGSEEVLY